ncbi:NAD-dependent epimerase/dehydratase family protein [Sediminibacterium soli]|uniref:NAD-dependent epimerase/dehydratase family protein n=1 Tax=Sediminibacterium soli TaxID=2698829 RepID=UPI00137A8A2E|nr:NAD-dependent epimerase/dehydratase family protein [Sediminibacterium soli]NCI45093.1 NAD-dependent epimerase/dehydratase family protein [Sediminibacterium soli]
MVLVTGATGLLGSHLVKRLVKDGEQVRALYRSAIPVFDGSDKVEWIRGDILDVVQLENAMMGVEQVYHCAAMVSFNPRRKKEMYKINVEGTANVVNACLSVDVKRLLHVSSIAAMGRIREDKPINEAMMWSQETSNSEYGRSKHLAELEIYRGIGEGLDTVIVNPVIILGSGDWHSSSTGIFRNVYKEFPWYTEGRGGFVDVLDAVNAMVLLMRTKNIISERFILCGVNMSYAELFDRIADIFHKKPPHKKVTPFIAALVWRWEAVKSWFTGHDPLLTRETARTAAAKIVIDNRKLQRYFVNFQYQPIGQSLKRICGELEKRYNLS